MNLWIRTQNKEELRPNPKLGLDGIKGEYYIVDRYDFEKAIILGVYKTEQRALEVLDEIQDVIISSSYMEINEKEVMTCGSGKVYEMPKK